MSQPDRSTSHDKIQTLVDERLDGYVTHSEEPHGMEVGDLIVVLSPCPGRSMRGGIGGQVMTACQFCGYVMASTAGPHLGGTWMHTPGIVTLRQPVTRADGSTLWAVEWRRLTLEVPRG